MPDEQQDPDIPWHEARARGTPALMSFPHLAAIPPPTGDEVLFARDHHLGKMADECDRGSKPRGNPLLSRSVASVSEAVLAGFSVDDDMPRFGDACTHGSVGGVFEVSFVEVFDFGSV